MSDTQDTRVEPAGNDPDRPAEDDPTTQREELELELMDEGKSEEGKEIGDQMD
jgi:hypothetical protein